MSKIVQGAQEAVAVAKGEMPAAAIWHNGHRYVPEAEIVRLRNVVREQHNVIAAAWDDKKNQQARAEAAEAERDRMREALERVLAWAEAVAGDNRFVAEAAEEVASVEQALAALKGDAQ